MMLNHNSPAWAKLCHRLAWVIFGVNLLLLSSLLPAQTTLGTAGIRGIVTNQNNVPIEGVSVTITDKSRGILIHTMTSGEGIYSSGPLQPGEYTVRVEAKGFKTVEFTVVTRVATVTGGDFQLQSGPETPAVVIHATETAVNTEQPTVQGVLLPSLMNLLPIGGRNFLDLAEFTPGVQFQDGGIFYPSKDGLSSISFDSRYGRAAQVEVDGVSIHDETFGATTQNIPASAIQEFTLSQSMLDLPVEVTSSGAVNIATRSGSNDLHGEAVGFFRGHEGAAALPGGSQAFDQEQYGARAGGAITKDKVFWFVSAERTQQDVTALENFVAPFNTLNGSLSEPFRDLQGDGRLDWQRRPDAHGFYRFGFDQVSDIFPFGPSSSLQGLRVATHTPSHTLGYDFTTGGHYTHSIRFEYLRTHSGMGDDSFAIPVEAGNPLQGLGISIGALSGNCSLASGGAFCAGSSPLVPQEILQSNIDTRYDGTRVLGSHVFRYGVAFNRIEAGGFAALYSNPQAGTNRLCLTDSTFPNCVTNPSPITYPADFVTLGNGLDFSTAKSAFGLPGGGLGPDNQIEAYIGDGWRIKHNVTLTYGVRYLRDTGRFDHNLGSLSVLNEWVPGLANPVRNPNTDFAPQFGFAWNVNNTGKTVIRGGAGVYYDSLLWSNMMLDSRARTAKGELSYTPQVCASGNPIPFVWPGSLAGSIVGSPVAGGTATVTNLATNQVSPTFCGSALSSAGSQILALNSAFQAATAANGAGQANPNYIPTALSAVNANGVDVFDPDFLTPRSYQMNLGFQHEVSPGTVFSLDYVRQIGEHNLIVLDANHSGSARSYNNVNAQAAADKVQAAANCPQFPGEAQCVINALGSVQAAQAAYSQAGLDANSATTGGGPCTFCAFPGITPFGQNNNGNVGGNGVLGMLDTLSTLGRSLYSGWQAKLVQRFSAPAYAIRTANIQVAYTYSKFTSQGEDTDFAIVPSDNDNPNKFTGPNGMDRKHQVSIGGTLEFPFFTKISFVAHFFSPLAQTLRMPELTNGGEIFATDWTGSGLGSGGPAEPVEGTQIGEFMRGTNISTLQRTLSIYNTNFAGLPTPAGHCLLDDASCPGSARTAVMTLNDLAALGWLLPSIPSVPQGALGPPWLKTFDIRAAWPLKVGDRFTIEPSATVFNVLNMTNAFLPGDLPNSSMLPGPNPTAFEGGILAGNVVGGVTKSGVTPFRAGYQSGTFSTGAPRQLEFGVRISF
jgi:hypothetical protein